MSYVIAAPLMDFAWLPPQINSARIYAGAGTGPLFIAASGGVVRVRM